MSHARLVPASLAVSLLLALTSCSGSSGGSDAAATTTAPEKVTTTTAAPPAEKLKILVSNDDGYSAEGIDTLVTGLQTLDDVEITVYAPLDQKSGTGGKFTDGKLAVTDVKLDSGYAARAVAGFPADTIRVAVDDEGLKPDLVIAGVNEGQNLGPLVDYSGTVGAARAGVARGIPSLATSQGLGAPLDYKSAVPFILDWVTEHRAALLAGDEPVAVTNLNFPTCPTGEIRGLTVLKPDSDGSAALALKDEQDCASTVALDEAAGDITAFNNGYATSSVIPDLPVTK